MKPNPQLDTFWMEHPEYDGRLKEYGAFGIPFVPIAAGAVGVRQSFKAPQNADVVLTSVFMEMLTAGSQAYAFPAPILVQYVNDAEARPINALPLDVFCVSGVGSTLGFPSVIWPWPITVKAKTQFSVIVTNQQNISFNLFFVFAGVKVFLPTASS